ncbi:MAG: cryptochrome/photolyase family protein [Candidatus Woesearchaeota archaeon]
MRSIFVFRRDLRLEDNTGLNKALNEGDVLPIFILDPRQLEGPYFSKKAYQFMLTSLKELDAELRKRGSKLNLYRGKPENVLERLPQDFDAVHVNGDYTPFSIERDKKIRAITERVGKFFFSHDDYMLNPPEKVLKQDGRPYSVFTPYYNNAKGYDIRRPETEKGTFLKDEDSDDINKIEIEFDEDVFKKGGRDEALVILKDVNRFINYENDRELPEKDGTTGLSAHNKFGTVSIREVYHKFVDGLGKEHALVRQLYWRDFFMQLAYHNPHVFGESFHKRFDGIRWRQDHEKFSAWCEGKTGFPIVDAGMRQLNTTGYMHNRLRMIVASFLTKDLKIDWRYGERYFAQKLLDYDPCVNNGSWQWAASTGADAQPYFRIFNPWRQQKRFDDSCRYIKKWVPELQDLSPSEIHALEHDTPDDIGCPIPIVDHKEESITAKEMFKEVKR